MSKSKYQIKKVRRVLFTKENNYNPASYEVWKVSGPKGFRKYFCSRKDAKAFVDSYTDTKLTMDIVLDLLREIKSK